MDCRSLKELLSGYIDGELTVPEREEADRHIADCPDCALLLAQLRETAGSIRTLPSVGAPPDFRPQVMALVRRSSRRRFNIKPWHVVAATAAALVIMVAAGGLFLAVTPGMLAGSGMKGLAPMEQMAGSDTRMKMDAPAPAPAPASERVESDEMRVASTPPVPEGRGGEDGYAGTSVAPLDFERKIVRSGELRVQTELFDEALQKVVFLIEAEGGYIQHSNMWTMTRGEDKYRSASYVLRVPAESYTRVLGELSKLGEVMDRNESGRDVTEEYYDTDSRVRNLRRQEDRLLEIMGRASTVDEILKVERELARVRGDIETLTGRLRYLDHVVAMSMIGITIEEPRPEEVGIMGLSLWERMVRSFLRTVEAIGRSLEQLVLFVAGALPVLAAVALIVFGIRYFRHRRA